MVIQRPQPMCNSSWGRHDSSNTTPGLVPTDVSDDSDDCRSNTGVLYFTATPRLPHEANAQVS